MKELERFVDQGRALLDLEEPVEAHSQFGHWLNNVSNWLSIKAPRSGLVEAWKAIGTSSLLVGSRYYNDKASWNIFRSVVGQRIEWLKRSRLDSAAPGKPVNQPASKAAVRDRVHVHGPEGPLRDAVLGFFKKLGIPLLDVPPARLSPSGLPGRDLDFSRIAFVAILFNRKTSGSGGPPSGTSSDASDPVLQGVLELGFFLGRVGAKRICVLAEPGLSIALDKGPILFVDADSAGAWQIELARSLKRAGILLDMNRVL